MATAQRSDLLIVAATLAVVGGAGLVAIVAPRQTTTKPTEIAVKGKPVAVQTRMKLPPRGPRMPRDTVVLPPQKKEVEIPRMRVPPPIMRPEATKAKKSKKAKKKARAAEKTERPRPKRTASLPSCARIRAAYNRMSVAERWAAYRSATPEQIAHGRRCLGL